MKAIILAAGYGTRMYPLTLDNPKCFLRYGGKRLIDYIFDDLEMTGLTETVVITNEKFFRTFEVYRDMECRSLTLVSDGSTSNENRLGAGNDLIYVLNKLDIDEECLVMASDNLIGDPMSMFTRFFDEKQCSCLMYYKEEDKSKLSRTGVVQLKEDGQVHMFFEKPNLYLSNLAVPPVYIFSRDTIRRIRRLKGQYDSPGLLIEKLTKSEKFYAYEMHGDRIDFGSDMSKLKQN